LSGVTSNLFSTLIPFFSQTQFNVFATERQVTAPQEGSDPKVIEAFNTSAAQRAERVKTIESFGVKFLSHEDALNATFDRVLWLSTHDDPELLAQFAVKAPTLVISSGAIMDYHRGKQALEDLNAYQRGKLALGNVPGVVTFIPGFYIEDIATAEWASKGLHSGTTPKLFGKPFYNGEDFDWGKCYSVTPKSFIIKAVSEWVIHPETFPKNEPVIVCSDRQYRRWELREFVTRITGEQYLEQRHGSPKGFATLSELEPVYSGFPHVVTATGKTLKLSETDITQACFQAARLANAKF